MSHNLSGRRRFHGFETLEPRRTLAADLATAEVDGGDLSSDMEMHLPGSIAGSVFAATSEGGVRRADDSGIGGVRLDLLDSTGDVLAETLTDENGAYEFPALAPGVYSVREWQPEGFLDGNSLIGTGGGVFIDANMIGDVVVRPGAVLVGYDFADRPEPAIAAIEFEVNVSLAGLIPNPVVHSPRPVTLVPPPAFEQVIIAPIRSAPLLMREAEPIFGGGSRMPDETEANPTLDAVSGDDEFERFVEATDSEEPLIDVDDERLPIDHRRQAAYDRAFELDAESEENAQTRGNTTPAEEPVAARRPSPSDRVARTPAA